MAAPRTDDVVSLANTAGAQFSEETFRISDLVASLNWDDWQRVIDGPRLQRLLEAARGAGVKRFLYAASSSCYGIPDSYPTPETAEIRPQYPYALTKNVAEQFVLHWGKIYGLPVVALPISPTRN